MCAQHDTCLGGESPLCEQAASSTSEAQGRHREMRSGGSAEQSRGPTNRNRIQGEVAQGERAFDREALSANESSRRSGGCAVKVTESYLGRSRFAPERATLRSGARS